MLKYTTTAIDSKNLSKVHDDTKKSRLFMLHGMALSRTSPAQAQNYLLQVFLFFYNAKEYPVRIEA